MNIIKNLDEIINAVVAVNTTISVISDGESFQWYKCDDYSNTNAQIIDGATTNELDVTQEEPKECYYYCLISKTGETTIPTKTCKVCTKVATDFLTHLAHDKDVLAAALAQLNGDNRDYNSMNYDQLVAEVMNLNLGGDYDFTDSQLATINSGLVSDDKIIICRASKIHNNTTYTSSDEDLEVYNFLKRCIDGNPNCLLYDSNMKMFYYPVALTSTQFRFTCGQDSLYLSGNYPVWKTFTINIYNNNDTSSITVKTIFNASASIEASNSQYGFVKVDGTTITANNGVISAKGVQSEECSSIKILTQIEYDALGNSVETDNVLYIIRD